MAATTTGWRNPRLVLKGQLITSRRTAIEGREVRAVVNRMALMMNATSDGKEGKGGEGIISEQAARTNTETRQKKA